MRNLILASAAALGVLASAGAVSAQPANAVGQAVALCRNTVAQQAGVSVDRVRLDQARERSRVVLVDVDLWSANNQLTNVRCEVAKGDTLTIANITPEITTATAQR